MILENSLMPLLRLRRIIADADIDVAATATATSAPVLSAAPSLRPAEGDRKLGGWRRCLPRRRCRDPIVHTPTPSSPSRVTDHIGPVAADADKYERKKPAPTTRPRRRAQDHTGTNAQQLTFASCTCTSQPFRALGYGQHSMTTQTNQPTNML